MKLIHLADLHIGSKFETMPDDIKADLSTKLRNCFSLIIQFAKDNQINVVLMSGDIFDKDSVTLKDKKFFYDCIRSNPSIDFYYLKGNHDFNSKYYDEISNLHTFDGIQFYEKENIRVIGYELDKDNSVLYNYVPFPTDKFNIMMLHGDIYNSNDKNFIKIGKLEDKNIDYFALGHIHKHQGGKQLYSKYEYPGCVMGRGFDECGEKGFLVLDTETNETTFHRLLNDLFERIEINASGMNEAELKSTVCKSLGEENNKIITELILTGKLDLEIDSDDLLRTFVSYRRHIVIKNKTQLNLSYSLNQNENSLRNMFINKILSDSSLDDDTKEKVISYGLSKLMKRDA